jgi:hypothetical protein
MIALGLVLSIGGMIVSGGSSAVVALGLITALFDGFVAVTKMLVEENSETFATPDDVAALEMTALVAGLAVFAGGVVKGLLRCKPPLAAAAARSESASPMGSGPLPAVKPHAPKQAKHPMDMTAADYSAASRKNTTGEPRIFLGPPVKYVVRSWKGQGIQPNADVDQRRFGAIIQAVRREAMNARQLNDPVADVAVHGLLAYASNATKAMVHQNESFMSSRSLLLRHLDALSDRLDPVGADRLFTLSNYISKSGFPEKVPSTRVLTETAHPRPSYSDLVAIVKGTVVAKK